MAWTQQQLDQLRTLRDAGHSAAQIAALLHVSRSAVLGAARRLRLPPPLPTVAMRRLRLRARLGQTAADEG
jgi:hypothetical protein